MDILVFACSLFGDELVYRLLYVVSLVKNTLLTIFYHNKGKNIVRSIKNRTFEFL